MDEKNTERELNDLGARLKQARKAQKGSASNAPTLRSERSGFGQAMGIGAELISALVVGTAIGWFLDRWLDTRPLMTIIFIFLGGAAGILNVFRSAMRMADDANDAQEGPQARQSEGAEKGTLDATESSFAADKHEK